MNNYLNFLLSYDKKEILEELKKFKKINRPELVDMIFDDSHAHFLKPKNKKELEQILDAWITKVNKCSITDWGDSVGQCLKYNDLKDIAKEYNGEYKIIPNGRIIKIKYKDKETIVYRSQEIRTRQHLHITAEGCDKTIPDELGAIETIERIHEDLGTAIIEHPATKVSKKFPYVFTNDEEDEFTLEVFKYADAAEVFNSTNSWWMFASNMKAKKLVEKFNENNKKKIAAIAGSDLHYGRGLFNRQFYVRNVGKSGIYLPKFPENAIDLEIISTKRNQLHRGEYKIFEQYTGLWDFFLEMVPPKIYKKLDLDRDSIS